MSELPPFYQEQVKANIDVPSLDSARATVAELTEAAKTCASPQPTTSPRPRPTPGSKPSPTPSQKPSVCRLHLRRAPLGDGAELLIMRDVALVTVVPRKRRGVELPHHLRWVLALGAYALVDLNVTVSCRRPSPTASAACSLRRHTAVRWRLPYADPVILPCVILLNGLGLVMIHRIDLINDPPLNGARQQLIWTALGVLDVHPGRHLAQ